MFLNGPSAAVFLSCLNCGARPNVEEPGEAVLIVQPHTNMIVALYCTTCAEEGVDWELIWHRAQAWLEERGYAETRKYSWRSST